MAIETDDLIDKFGTTDSVDDGTTSTIADINFSVAADISAWTNDDDAPFANFVLECQFDTTPPTNFVGSIDLYARPMNVEDAGTGTGDPNAPATDNFQRFIGSFQIDWGVTADTNMFLYIHKAELLNFLTSQIYEFYIFNNNTGQTIGVDWNLWITPVSMGPHA